MRKFAYEVKSGGMDAEAAAKITLKAEQYYSDVKIGKDGHFLNGKSLVGMTTLEIHEGDMLDVEINGEDEIRAENGLRAVLNEVLG